MQTQDRPTEPGVWVREGKFYRVFGKPGGAIASQEITANGDFLQSTVPPTGNWRKLTAATCEERSELVELRKYFKLTEDARGKQHYAADCLLEHFNEFGELRGEGAWRGKAIFAWVKKFIDAENALSDQVNFEIKKEEIADKAAEIFAGVKRADDSQPEVIEGDGQSVSADRVGYWLFKRNSETTPQLAFLGMRDVFYKNHRYIRCPEIPPRPTFTAPPKPELVLARAADGCNGEPFYVTKRDAHCYRAVETGTVWHKANLELLDDEGNVIR